MLPRALWGAILGLILLVLAVPGAILKAGESEKTVLGGLLSKTLSTPSSQVSIGAVDGALSSDATIRDVTISDGEGVWLKLDRARLVWRRLALLSGRLEIDTLEIGKLEVLRRPVPGAAPEEAEPDGSLLPDLPVKIEVKAFRLAELILGETVAGQSARLAAAGKAKLGNPAEGLDISAEADRLDARGHFDARLLFVPKSQTLEVKASLIEDQGGLLSKAGNLPGEPPINLALDGRGTLDSWNAKLDFDAGPEIGAKGGARISRIGAERRLSLDLASRIEGLLPGPAAAVFAGTTKLEGSLGFADSGAFRIDRLDLTSRTARLGAVGSITADRVADLTVQARAVPTEGGVTKAVEAELQTLVFDASLKGPLASPRIKGLLKAAGLRTSGSTLDRIEADVSVEPLDATAKSPRFVLSADARMEGLSLADPALRKAVGDRASLTLRAASTVDGNVDVEAMRFDASTAKLEFKGRVGQNTLAGTVEAALTDLGAFSGIAGRDLAGRLEAKAKLSGDPARKSLAADLDLKGHDVVYDVDVAERLMGRAPSLTGRVFQTYDGYGFENLRLAGSQASADLHGTATRAKADVVGKIAIRQLAVLDERLGGTASIEGRLTGSLRKPNLAAAILAPDATAMGKPVKALRIETALADLTGALSGAVRLSGEIAGKPLTGASQIARPNPDTWSVQGLSFALGSVAVEGGLELDSRTKLGAGRLAIRAGNLDDLSVLALAPMGGSLDALVTLSREAGRQDATLRAKAAALRYDRYGLTRLDADLTGRDLLARPVLDGSLSADRLIAAGETIDSLRLNATGTPAASDIVLTAKARGFGLDGAARLVPGEAIRIELQRFAAARGPDKLALAGPASVTLRDGEAVIEGLAIAAGSGRISVQGRAGQDLDLAIGIRALPLAIARIAKPGLALAGTLDGEAEIRGTPQRPAGRYSLSVAHLVAAETRKAGLPPIDAKASGTLEEGFATIDGRLSAGRGAEVTVAGSVPIEPGAALALRARGNLDAALANSLLSTGGQRVTGRVALDAGVSGTLAAPKVEGSATLSGGSVTDPLNGIRLTDIQGRITGRGDTLVIERLTAATRNGGRLAIDGRVAVEPASGFPGQLRITAERAELVSSPLMTAVTSANLALTGPLARTPRIAGRVDVVSIDVSVPDRLPATVQPLPGIRRVNTTPGIRTRLAQRKATAAPVRKGRAAAPFDATLDLVVSAPNRIFVRGRGIDAELGGELRIAGSSRDPRANGDFEMRRGRFSLVGQRLDFTRGRLTFEGDLTTPELDFLAETKVSDVTARVAVTGPANQPGFALTSDPALPQDEILSRLLFKKAAGGLSPFQALQLAQAVGQLSGGGGGPDVFEAARKGLGLDSLDVSTGASGGPAVGASRYIGDKLSVGVRAGAQPADNAATINYDVTRRIKIQGEAGSDGRTAVGVGAEYEW